MRDYTGYKQAVKRTYCAPYQVDERLTATSYYRGYISCWESGRKLWSESTGINRVSRGESQKDCRKLIHDHILINNL